MDSALFPDVINCMQTDNLELKKLVYLYLMNYAKSQPDMAIMAVNTFVKVGAVNDQGTPRFLCAHSNLHQTSLVKHAVFHTHIYLSGFDTSYPYPVFSQENVDTVTARKCHALLMLLE